MLIISVLALQASRVSCRRTRECLTTISDSISALVTTLPGGSFTFLPRFTRMPPVAGDYLQGALPTDFKYLPFFTYFMLPLLLLGYAPAPVTWNVFQLTHPHNRLTSLRGDEGSQCYGDSRVSCWRDISLPGGRVCQSQNSI